MLIIRIAKKFNSILSAHQKLRIFELAVLMVIGGLLELCSVSLILPFMDAVMSPQETMQKPYVQLVCRIFDLQIAKTFLVFTAIVLACVYIFKNVYLLLQMNVQNRFVYGNMLAMQRRVLDSYLNKPYEYFLGVSSGEIVRVMNTDIPNVFNLLSTLIFLFTELVVSTMLIAAIFIYSPLITLCMGGVMGFLLIVISAVIKPLLRRAGENLQYSGKDMNKWLLQSIQGIKEVKITGKEAFFQENFDTSGQVYVTSMRKHGLLSTVPRFLIEAFSMSTIFIVIALLIYRDYSLETIVPMLSAVAMAAIRLLPSVNRISSSMANAAYYEPMLDKLIESLKDIDGSGTVSLAGNVDAVHDDGGDVTSAPLRESIEFREISFHYPDAENDVLSHASMTIRRGESVGIVGASGAGKTTAIDILLGLLHPQKGQVLADGADISEDVRSWHRQIGYIPQMIFMLDDTIRANVAFGVAREAVNDEVVWQALEEASLADFVRGLPEGLDTEIGERGVRLSGGQRQRIGIARALYRKPDVLVLDEATSALDNETEREIMASIERLQGQKTMIIIAHRLTTIEQCDHVYRVEGGRITLEK